MTPRVPMWSADLSLVWTRYPDSDEWVVYHPLAGTVHCLTDSAHLLWELACERPRTTEDLFTLLASRFERTPVEDLDAILRETLESMDRSGLVQAVV